VPIVRIDTTGPKSHVYKTSLMKAVREAVVTELAAADERVTVRVHETEAECVDVPACRSDLFTVIEILLYAGRTPEAKAACVSAIRSSLGVDPGIPASEVVVAFHDSDPVDLDVLPDGASI
jgi:phenylpyruvate tautomerase PptA (4-oxalocrotonate tautomerase family)